MGSGGHDDVCEGFLANTTEDTNKCLCECITESHVSIGVESIVGNIIGVHLTELSMMGIFLSCPGCGHIFRSIQKGHHHEEGHHNVESLLGHFMVPESGFVIVIGIIIGLIVKGTGLDKELDNELMHFNPEVFFLLFTPPILIKATYFSQKTVLVHNIGMISYHTIVGTLYFTFFLAGALYYLTLLEFSFVECLVLSGLLACVDPVPVLECLHEEKVNHRLFELVEQEAIFKHATGIIIYGLFLNFTLDITSENLHLVGSIFGLGILKFVLVIGLGAILGMVVGFCGSLFSRFSYKKHMHHFQPLIVYLTCIMGYFITETFLGIGVLGLVGSTLFMSRYVKYNLSKKSRMTINQTMKMLAAIAENLIFLYLGIAIIDFHHEFNWTFILVCNVGCIVIRFIFIFTTNTMWNVFFLLAGKHEEVIPRRDTFIMAFSGVRGALTFALAFVLPDDYEHKDLYVTTALSVIIFTVFVQGTLIGPLIHLFGIEKAHMKLSDKVHKYEKIKKNLRKVLYLIPHPDTQDEVRRVMTRDCTRNYKKCVHKVNKFMIKCGKDFILHTHKEKKREERRLKKEAKREKKKKKRKGTEKVKKKKEEEKEEGGNSCQFKPTLEHDCEDVAILKQISSFLKDDAHGYYDDDTQILEAELTYAYKKREKIHEMVKLVEGRIADLYKFMRYKDSVVKIPRDDLEKIVGRSHVSEVPPEWLSNKISEEGSVLMKMLKGFAHFFVVIAHVSDKLIQLIINRRGWMKKEVKFSRATVRFKSHCEANYNTSMLHGDEDLVYLKPGSSLRKKCEEGKEGKNEKELEEEESEEEEIEKEIIVEDLEEIDEEEENEEDGERESRKGSSEEEETDGEEKKVPLIEMKDDDQVSDDDSDN